MNERERPAGPRLAVVTGGSRGLGATLANFLGESGCDLVVNGRDPVALEAAAERLRGLGGTVWAVPGDVRSGDVRNRIRDVVERAGHLELLINNASELGPSPLLPVTRISPDELMRIFEVNVVSPIALVQLLAPFLERAEGLVVDVSSDAALGGYPGWAGYGASKAALDLVTKTMAEELRHRGISTVSVDPGDMRTAMHQAAFPGEDISDRPLPEVTIPFWAWLLGQRPSAISGGRYRAQADHWEVVR